MNPEALIFIQNRNAQRLIASWPKVGKGKKLTLDDRIFWSEISGVALSSVVELEPILFEHEICFLNGTVNETVLKKIQEPFAEKSQSELKNMMEMLLPRN